MSAEWTRYSCQLNLPGFDAAAQQKLADARVLIVGAGGLGCPVAQYLVSSGVGNITLADHDTVSEKNLHRQILYTPNDVGKGKAIAAREKLLAQNPAVSITAYEQQVDGNNVMGLVAAHDIVVDCTDNFETRYLLNDACVLSGKPLVYGAIYQYEGQVAVWNITNPDGSKSPNYRDLYPNVNAAAVPNCADGGVIPTIAGIIGLMQANEVIKYITGIGELLAGRLLVFDALTMQSRTIKLGAATKTDILSLSVSTTVHQISYEEVQHGDYFLIDVRTTAEREVFHIGGVHIPLNEVANTDIDADTQIVCYCASGMRSAEAVKTLMARYPEANISSLQGGLNSLKQSHQG